MNDGNASRCIYARWRTLWQESLEFVVVCVIVCDDSIVVSPVLYNPRVRASNKKEGYLMRYTKRMACACAAVFCCFAGAPAAFADGLPIPPLGAAGVAFSQSMVAGSTIANHGMSAAGASSSNSSYGTGTLAGDPAASSGSTGSGMSWAAGQRAASSFGASGFGFGFGRF